MAACLPDRQADGLRQSSASDATGRVAAEQRLRRELIDY